MFENCFSKKARIVSRTGLFFLFYKNCCLVCDLSCCCLYLRHFESETSDHQYDLSHFIWTSEKHYMDNYYVSVTAVLGGSQSDPVQSETFTFNNVKTADLTCE